jgi:CobQ/CobB/MinD/ParA family nucleotide binding protein
VKSEEKKVKQKKVYITAGTKGGVGKSTAAIYFSDTLSELEIPHINIDCDNENPTFKRFLGERVQELDISGPFGMDQLISIIDTAYVDHFVIDLKAGTGNETLVWFDDVPLEKMNDEGTAFYLMGCITSNPDSVKTFLNWAGVLKQRVRYILISNEKESNDFSVYEEHAKVFDKAAKPLKVVIPKLHEIYTTALNQLGAPLSDHLEGRVLIHHEAFQGRVPQSRLLRYYRQVIDQIIKVIESE